MLLLSLKLLFFSQLIKGTVLRLKTSGTNQVMISDDARCPPKARFGRRTGGARCADHWGLTTLAGASRGDGLEARKSRKSSLLHFGSGSGLEVVKKNQKLYHHPRAQTSHCSVSCKRARKNDRFSDPFFSCAIFAKSMILCGGPLWDNTEVRKFSRWIWNREKRLHEPWKMASSRYFFAICALPARPRGSRRRVPGALSGPHTVRCPFGAKIAPLMEIWHHRKIILRLVHDVFIF